MSTSDKASASRSSDYLDGLAIRFKFPKGANLALRSVQINDDIPEFLFTAANKVPTITEEDVATCVRLCLDNKRPEFFYVPFLPGHPFAGLGRHFKYYRPSYLRGTSVGELLAEVDWKMKCLHVGVKSDEEKENFSSWPETSELDGLATYDDFPREIGTSQILMACESVDVYESEDELRFVGEPKMKITDNVSPSYSKYITSNFDAVAYYDEPRFLKMKEIIKLVLAVEWLRDKGVEFSEDWVKEHTDKPRRESPKPVEVKLSDEETNLLMEQLKNGAAATLKTIPELPASNLIDTRSSVQIGEKTARETGFEFKVVQTFYVGLCEPLIRTVVARATLNDFDMLYNGINPNLPVSLDGESGKPIIPDVDSWCALYRETMPFPCKWLQHPDNPGVTTPVLIGGVTTSSIPVQKSSSVHVPEPVPVRVKASTKKDKPQKVPSATIPKQNVVHAPPTAARVNTPESNVHAIRRRSGTQERRGWTDSTATSVSTSNGRVREEQTSLHSTIEESHSIGGKEIGQPHRSYMNFPLPPIQTTGPNSVLVSGQPIASPTHSEDRGYPNSLNSHTGDPQPMQQSEALPLKGYDDNRSVSDSGISIAESESELSANDASRLEQPTKDDASSIASDSGISSMSDVTLESLETESNSDSNSTIADTDEVQERYGDFDDIDGDKC